MKPRLLDINVLIALAFPAHVHHHEAQAWFTEKRPQGFRTCPLTEAGFVRISSNPSFTRHAVTPRGALSLLGEITSLPEHEFWPDHLSLLEAIPPQLTIASHRQITDVYLLGLAASRGGILATFDRGVLAVAVGREQSVEIL